MSQICEIYCRHEGPLQVPLQLLQKSKVLTSYLAKKPGNRWGGREVVEFEEVPLNVGHVLVHFLHTDRYQCLAPETGDFNQATRTEFETAVQVFSTAEKYELESLCSLAEIEMRRLGKALNILDIIDVLDGLKVSSTLMSNISSYLESRMLETCESLSSQEDADSLLNLSGPTTISRIIFRCLIQLGSKRQVNHSPESGTDPVSDIPEPELAEKQSCTWEEACHRSKIPDLAEADWVEKEVAADRALSDMIRNSDQYDLGIEKATHPEEATETTAPEIDEQATETPDFSSRAWFEMRAEDKRMGTKIEKKENKKKKKKMPVKYKISDMASQDPILTEEYGKIPEDMAI